MGCDTGGNGSAAESETASVREIGNLENGPLGQLLKPFGDLFRASWGALWELLGACWGFLGPPGRFLGALLGASWAFLGPPGRLLGTLLT